MARNLLEAVTPLKADCGKRCGAACCKPDSDGRGGMRLYPGEEEPPWARVEDGLLVCDGSCPRAERPLACRFFPLVPVLRDGEVQIELDRRAWPVCPLMEFGMRGLNPAFVAAAREAAAILAKDEACRAMIAAQTGEMDAYGAFS